MSAITDEDPLAQAFVIISAVPAGLSQTENWPLAGLQMRINMA